MTKNTLPKFLIGAGVLLFIFELLNFNYDAPTDGELISFLLRLLVPINLYRGRNCLFYYLTGLLFILNFIYFEKAEFK